MELQSALEEAEVGVQGRAGLGCRMGFRLWSLILFSLSLFSSSPAHCQGLGHCWTTQPAPGKHLSMNELRVTEIPSCNHFIYCVSEAFLFPLSPFPPLPACVFLYSALDCFCFLGNTFHFLLLSSNLALPAGSQPHLLFRLLSFFLCTPSLPSSAPDCRAMYAIPELSLYYGC